MEQREFLLISIGSIEINTDEINADAQGRMENNEKNIRGKVYYGSPQMFFSFRMDSAISAARLPVASRVPV